MRAAAKYVARIAVMVSGQLVLMRAAMKGVKFIHGAMCIEWWTVPVCIVGFAIFGVGLFWGQEMP